GSSSTGLMKTGSGTLQFAGGSANTYAGPTVITGGTLELNKSTTVKAIPGDGNASTVDVLVNGGTLKCLSPYQFDNVLYLDQPSGSSIVLASGTVDLNGTRQLLGSFTNSGGTFTNGVGGPEYIINLNWGGGVNTVSASSSSPVSFIESTRVVVT